ncbi:hypothetical protein Goarm_004710, partial [Gossypium armourianum]|nr:hypothetical protein [Gossypium armourianum]
MHRGNAKSSTPMVEGSTTAVGKEPFGPWIIVEQRSQQNQKNTCNQKVNFCKQILESLDLMRGLAGKKTTGIDEVQPDISGIRSQKGEFLKKLKGLKGGAKSGTLENKKTVAGNMGQSNDVITSGPSMNSGLRKGIKSHAKTHGNSSLHFNHIFEGPIKSALELNPKILNPKRHRTVTFKENLDPNLNFSSQSEGVLESENSLPDSKGRNSRRDRTLSKAIRGSGGHFKVFLKVSPWKKVIRFGHKGKLNPRFIGPYHILKHVRSVTYQLELPHELDQIHNVFHEVEIRLDLTFEEEPVQILDRDVKVLRKETISLVKVLWRNHGTEEATWELEDSIRQQYPYLFESALQAWPYRLGRVWDVTSLVGKVAKLDIKTDNGMRGHFARMAIYVDLEKPLCIENGNAKSSTPTVEGSSTAVGEEPFGPWMIVEQISHQNQKDTRNQKKLKGLKGGANSRPLENRKTVTGNIGQSSELGENLGTVAVEGSRGCADCLTNLDGQNVGDLAPTKQIDIKR